MEQRIIELSSDRDIDCDCGCNLDEKTRYIGGGYGYKYGCVDEVSCPMCNQTVVLRERYYD